MRSRRVLGSLGVRNNIGLCTRTISCAPFYVSSARSAPASQWGRRMYADQAEEEEKPFRSPDFHRVPDIVPEEKLKVYTREEVANHNTPEDCWVIVNKRIYNVSLWSDLHPGGRDVLYRNAGKDATDLWAMAGHSVRARYLMDCYLIGRVETEKRFTGQDQAAVEFDELGQRWLYPDISDDKDYLQDVSKWRDSNITSS